MIMWKTLFIIAVITAVIQWALYSFSPSAFILAQAVLWSIWAGFCAIKLFVK